MLRRGLSRPAADAARAPPPRRGQRPPARRRGARLLAQTSGGAIPEIADYRVVLEPDGRSSARSTRTSPSRAPAGDVFQLGNASWRILQVARDGAGRRRQPARRRTIPFWLGEAPARSDELSRRSASCARRSTAAGDGVGSPEQLAPHRRLDRRESGVDRDAVEQLVTYLADGRRTLGDMPSQQTLLLERFFDEAGGMQLVLHAPFGSRVNRAWGLALRKRFCRSSTSSCRRRRPTTP
jgi:ATP-dependent helicase Lhr and Lhr-like helicase